MRVLVASQSAKNRRTWPASPAKSVLHSSRPAIWGQAWQVRVNACPGSRVTCQVATASVGSNGVAFGVANNSLLTVMDLLLAADQQAVGGLLYGGNAALRKQANNVFSAINDAGQIGN